MIVTQNLTKKYGRVTAVNRLNLQVHRGTVFGMVGENGAGKTTTLSMLATLSTPTSGHALINGYDVTKHPGMVRKSMAFMPDSFGVYDDLSVEEYLEFYADCYGVPRPTMIKRRHELLEKVQLSDKAQSYVNALSRGMQQRLELARCLMHDPEVLILDEPTSGLDPRSRIEFRNVLLDLRSMGKTVLISSHMLYELSEVADEIGIIRNGELAAVASVKVMLSHSNAYRTLCIRTLTHQQSKLEDLLRDDSHVVNLSYVDNETTVVYAGTLAQQAELVRSLVEAGIQLTQVTERPADIEALFLRLTSEH